MIILKLVCLYLSVSYALTNLLKIKIEESLIIGTGLIYLILYLCGILNHLLIGMYIIFGIFVVSSIYSIFCIVKKRNYKELLKPSIILWIFGIIALYFICVDTNFVSWDEFSHWGTNLKAMYNLDILWADKLWDGVHVVYPPLAGLIEYLGLKIYGNYSEWATFFTLDVFLLNFIVIIFRNYKNKFFDYLKGFLSLFCIFCVIYIFNLKLNTIYIDLALGILFFIGLYLGTLNFDKRTYILLSIIFVLLPMMKDSGLIFSAIILIEIFIKNILYEIIENRKITKNDLKKILPIIIFLVLIFSSYFSWKFYASFNGHQVDFQHDSNAVMEFNLIEYIKSILLITNNAKNYDITCSFYNYINTSEVITRMPFKTIIQIIIAFNMFCIIFILHTKKAEVKKKFITIISTIDLGAILYLLFLLLIFLFAFLEPEGRTLASFERYIATFFVGIGVLLVALCFENKEKAPIITCLLICLFGMNIITIIKPNTKNINVFAENIITNSEKIKKYIDNNEKVYIVMQNTNGEDFHKLRYLISPIQTNLLYEWNVGEINTVSYLATINLSIEEWHEKLKKENFDYIYLINVDEVFVETYGKMFEKSPNIENLTDAIYKISYKQNEISLERVS